VRSVVRVNVTRLMRIAIMSVRLERRADSIHPAAAVTARRLPDREVVQSFRQ
jgi:hypothetical protein